MSLKGDKYETTEEVKFRLEHTIVLYDNSPVYITNIATPRGTADDEDSIARVYFYELPLIRGEDKEIRKYLSSKKFDLSPFKMGYMNTDRGVCYVSRTPIRQNRQGLCAGNTKIVDHMGLNCNFMNFNSLIKEQGFVDMVLGKYPSFKQATEIMENTGVESVAISNNVAFYLDKDLDALILLHKNIRCGIALRGDKGIRLSRKYHFLKQEIEEFNIPLI